MEKTDIFPRTVSNEIRKIKYFNFFQYFGVGNLYVFITYMESENNKIYYKKLRLDDRSKKHMMDVLKGSRDYTRPEKKLSWNNISKKLKLPRIEVLKKNMDIRAGYKYHPHYLVKTYFTFGQRKVEPGTAHVYQTLEVPLKLYVAGRRATKEEKYFIDNEQKYYTAYSMKPNGCYRINPGIVYIILTTQKCLFSLDIVAEDYNIPFEYRDPIDDVFREPRDVEFTHLSSNFDQPVPTPLIDHVTEEEDIQPSTSHQGDVTATGFNSHLGVVIKEETNIHSPNSHQGVAIKEETNIHSPTSHLGDMTATRFNSHQGVVIKEETNIHSPTSHQGDVTVIRFNSHQGFVIKEETNIHSPTSHQGYVTDEDNIQSFTSHQGDVMVEGNIQPCVNTVRQQMSTDQGQPLNLPIHTAFARPRSPASNNNINMADRTSPRSIHEMENATVNPSTSPTPDNCHENVSAHSPQPIPSNNHRNVNIDVHPSQSTPGCIHGDMNVTVHQSQTIPGSVPRNIKVNLQPSPAIPGSNQGNVIVTVQIPSQQPQSVIVPGCISENVNVTFELPPGIMEM